MKNGKIPFGQRVRIGGIPDGDTDAGLNGLTGTLHRKFFTKDNPFRVFGEVGVWLDTPFEGARVVNVRRCEVTRAASDVTNLATDLIQGGSSKL